MYESDDENRRILFGKYLESLRARSARNTNEGAAELLNVTDRTFQRILKGQNANKDTRKNLHVVLQIFIDNIDDGDPILDFDTWVSQNEQAIIATNLFDEINDGDQKVVLQHTPLTSRRFSIHVGATIAALVVVFVAISVWLWFSEEAEQTPDVFVEGNAADAETFPNISPTAAELQEIDSSEIDVLKITKSGERRRSIHHPPRALFTVWNGKIFLKDLILPNYNPISKIEYSRFSNAWTVFEPSDDLLDRSLAPNGEFLVKATYVIGGKEAEKEYDLTTQKDYHLRTVVKGFDITSRVGNISRHVSCVDDLCAVQRSHNNNLLCFGPVTRGRLISGFDKYEVDRSICTQDAPLPLCLSEKELGFKLGREARVVFEVDLIDGTSKRFDVSPRTEGVLRPNGDFVALDALGATLTHKCD